MGGDGGVEVGTAAGSGSLGLALSGGAVLGCAHIGVLQALEEREVRVTHLAGTSIGALIGSFYAFGLTGKEIEGIAERLRWPDLTRPSPSRLGLLSQEKLRDLLRTRLGNPRIEDASIPLALVATDISTGEKVVMTEGDLALAASASACFPGIFIPVEREGRLLVDGGLVENLPLSPLQAWGVDRIVAVDAFLGMTFHRPTKLMDLIKNAVDIALVQAPQKVAEEVDLLIAPDLAFSSTELKEFRGSLRRDTERRTRLWTGGNPDSDSAYSLSWIGRGFGQKEISAYPGWRLRWPGTVAGAGPWPGASPRVFQAFPHQVVFFIGGGQDLLEGREGGIELPLFPFRCDAEEHGPEVVLGDVEVPSFPGEVHFPNHPPMPEVLQAMLAFPGSCPVRS